MSSQFNKYVKPHEIKFKLNTTSSEISLTRSWPFELHHYHTRVQCVQLHLHDLTIKERWTGDFRLLQKLNEMKLHLGRSEKKVKILIGRKVNMNILNNLKKRKRQLRAFVVMFMETLPLQREREREIRNYSYYGSRRPLDKMKVIPRTWCCVCLCVCVTVSASNLK